MKSFCVNSRNGKMWKTCMRRMQERKNHSNYISCILLGIFALPLNDNNVKYGGKLVTKVCRRENAEMHSQMFSYSKWKFFINFAWADEFFRYLISNRNHKFHINIFKYATIVQKVSITFFITVVSRHLHIFANISKKRDRKVFITSNKNTPNLERQIRNLMWSWGCSSLSCVAPTNSQNSYVSEHNSLLQSFTPTTKRMTFCKC